VLDLVGGSSTPYFKGCKGGDTPCALLGVFPQKKKLAGLPMGSAPKKNG